MVLPYTFLTVLSSGDAGGSGTVPPVGQVAASVNFPGDTGKYLTSEGDFPIDAQINYSLAVWIRPTSLGVPSNPRGVIGKGINLSVPLTFLIGMAVNYTFDRVEFYHSDGLVLTTLPSANSSLTDATWHFVAVTYNSVTTTLSLSINNGTPVTATSVESLQGLASDTLLGFLSSTGFDPFLGQMSLLGAWNKVLSASEITSLYNAGAGKAYGNLTAGEKTSLCCYCNLDEASTGVAQVDRDDDSDFVDGIGKFLDGAHIPSSSSVPS